MAAYPTWFWYTGGVSELYKRKPNTSCFVCSKPVYRRPAETQKNGRAFCGLACYGMASRKEKPCIVCGALILASKNAVTCSRSCANRHRVGIKYKLGRPKKDKVQNQRGLKLRLIAQRGAKCEKCTYSRIEILQVHHKDRDRKHNNLENLSLICPNCHAEEHYLENSWLSASVTGTEGSDSGSFQRT